LGFFLAEEGVEKQSFRESVYEMLFLIKVCLTCVWFWVPSLFALFVVFELYMIYINPLLLLVGPGIMIVCALIWEERRVKAQYGFTDVKVVKNSDPLFSGPRRIEKDVDVERLVKEYAELTKKKNENDVENRHKD
jgi:hypothetical protein